jgi:cobalt-zinc-cadmium efflux system outer membrane protein
MTTTTFFGALLVCCVVLLLPTRPYAQQTMDFTTALQLARKNNPDWRAAEQEVEIARGKLTTARLISPFNPVIEGLSGRRTIPGESRGTDYAVGLSMEVEVAGQRGLRISESERNLERAEASFRDFQRGFRAKLARAFYQAIFARSLLEFLRRVEGLNLRLLEVTRVKFEAGDISGLEVNVSVVRHGQSRKETFDGERDLAQALLELKRLVGIEETLLPIGDLGVTVPPVQPKEILDRAMANRADLLAKRRELRRAETEIALRKREVFPNPTLGVLFDREFTGERFVGGTLSIPLPIFNRNQGELESLGARRILARAEILALEKEIRKEVDQAISQWETARKSIDFFQREVIEQTEENFRLLEAAYRERRIDLPRLLIMENDLIAANQSYLEIRHSLQEAAIRLEEVSGELPNP